MAIDGFKVAVTSDEVRDLLHAVILEHEEKVIAYEEALAKILKAGESERDQSFDTVSSLRGKVKEHRDKAAQSKFLRDHVIPNEVYHLGRHDLDVLGQGRGY